MSVSQPVPPHAPRKAARDVRRQQLIDATIKVLGQKGFASLTIADVARTAGLSAGIVIFHFTSKDSLLTEVLRFLSDEFRQNWRAALEQSGSSAEERLVTLLLSSFTDNVCQPDRLSAWLAFWAEVQGRASYDEICSGPDAERMEALRSICAEIISANGYDHDPGIVALHLDALTDGLWFRLATRGPLYPDRVSMDEAKGMVAHTLATIFPRQFAAPAA